MCTYSKELQSHLLCVFSCLLGSRPGLWVGFPTSVFHGWTCIQKCVLMVHKNSVFMCYDAYNALSVTLEAHSRVSYSVIMKGIGWRRQVLCMHGSTCHIQINADRDVNKWHFAWYVFNQCLISPSRHDHVSHPSVVVFKGTFHSIWIYQNLLEEEVAVYLGLIGFGCGYLLRNPIFFFNSGGGPFSHFSWISFKLFIM